MKILVFSDSHGNYLDMEQAIKMHQNAEVIIHCGDGEAQSQRARDSYPDKMVIRVRGNCDLGSSLPLTENITLNGKKIFITHGHYYEVKYGLRTLRYAAMEKKYDIVLFGHTHDPLVEYYDGIYYMNPGSCTGYHASYGILDIDENGSVLMSIGKL